MILKHIQTSQGMSKPGIDRREHESQTRRSAHTFTQSSEILRMYYIVLNESFSFSSSLLEYNTADISENMLNRKLIHAIAATCIL